MASKQLKRTSILLVPEHLTQLQAVAKARGSNASVVIRTLIVGYLRRAQKESQASV
jgi:hypothetical protein